MDRDERGQRRHRHAVAAAALAVATALAVTIQASSPATAAEPASNVDENVLVALTYWKGIETDGTAVEDLVDSVNGPIRDYFAASTGGLLNFTVTDSKDWTKVDRQLCDPKTGRPEWWEYEQAVRRATGWKSTVGQHLLIYVPVNNPCGQEVAGIAYPFGERDDGGAAFVFETEITTIAHELGHTLGLGHANSVACERKGMIVPDDDWQHCTVVTYADQRNVMSGAGSEGMFTRLNASNLTDLGIKFRSTDVVASGSYDLDADWVPGGVKALKVSNNGATYWISLSAVTGKESWLRLGDPFAPSVVVHKSVVGTETVQRDGAHLNPRDSYLLLIGSTEQDIAVPDVPSTRWVPLVDAGAWITVDSITDDHATVKVVFGDKPSPIQPVKAVSRTLPRSTLLANVAKWNTSKRCQFSCPNVQLAALAAISGVSVTDFKSVDEMMRTVGYTVKAHPLRERAPIGSIIVWTNYNSRYVGAVSVGGGKVALYDTAKKRIEIKSRTSLDDMYWAVGWLEPQFTKG